jgi:UDP-N-acetylglucosamine 2-epimerase (non-hydrolysing)
MKIMTVVGARPNFMKAAPIITAISEHNDRTRTFLCSDDGESRPELIHHVLVHTGQHYDQAMSDTFFADLGLANPDVHLGVGSRSHAAQTAEIMVRFEEVLCREKPDLLIVVGDVNSTLACALVAAKISFDASGTRPLIAHVEAGLRSFDRSMPEEINRIFTDQVADLLFVTEESGLRNLEAEGIPPQKIHFVGNTMIDSLLTCKSKARASGIMEDLGLCEPLADNDLPQRIEPYVLLTLHRASNVDCRDTFVNILEGLEEVASEYPVIFPAHPRTQKRISEFGLEPCVVFKHMHYEMDRLRTADGIRMIGPVGYVNFLCLMINAKLVVTDSGGIQEETTCLGVPCVTVRENTERPVTVTTGTNMLAGVKKQSIRDAIRRQLTSPRTSRVPEKWDGKSGVRIVNTIIGTFEAR